MRILKDSTARTRFIALCVGIIAFTSLLVGLISNISGAWPVIETATGWLATRLVTTGEDAVRLTPLGWTLIVGFFALFVALGVAGKIILTEPAEITALKAENKDLIREIEDEAGASRDMIDVLFEGKFHKHFHFHEIRFDHLLKEDGDVHIRRELTLSSDNLPAALLHFVEYGDEESSPITAFHLLKLSVTDSRGGRVVVKPLNTDYLKRQFVIALADELPAGAPVTITLEFCWPGYFQRAVDYGRAEYVMHYQATNQDSDTRFQCRFRLAKNAPELNFSGVGRDFAQCKPLITVDLSTGETIWDFVKSDLDSTKPIKFVVSAPRK